MHMLLGLTLMHDAHLASGQSSPPYTRLKYAGLHHWNIGSTLFNHLLAQPIAPAKRDAIWATAVIIGATSFWYVADDVEHAWPLKPSEPDDLAWLRLGKGKKTLWRIADPTRAESVFCTLMRRRGLRCRKPPAAISTTDTDTEVIGISEEVKHMFNITKASNNVYHLPLQALSRIQHVRLTHENVRTFYDFSANITPEFMHLIEAKDPRAVFIIGWWFSIIEGTELWWMASRAKVEGRAVRLWLQRQEETQGLATVLNGLVRQARLKTTEDSNMTG
jgi:hypothetical protein